MVVVVVEVGVVIRGGVEVGVHGGGVGGVCMAVPSPDLGDLRDNKDVDMVGLTSITTISNSLHHIIIIYQSIYLSSLVVKFG